jgi:hypothetical protein
VRVERRLQWLLIILVESSVEYQKDKIVVVFSFACLLCDLIDVRYRVNISVIKVTSSVLRNAVG